MTDYQHDMHRIDRDEASLRALPALDKSQIARLAYRQYQRAALTGRLEDFASAEAAITDAFERIGPWPDLCLIKANLDMKFHRLAETKQDLAMAAGLSESFAGRVILADIRSARGALCPGEPSPRRAY